jgi:general secretion pathway protein A
MFLDFYQMREQPFGVTPDPRFLFLGRSHREALASLFYGIESDRGFMALIAEPGLGKTTLTFQLLEKLQRVARTVFLFQTQCNSRELFEYLLNDLGIECAGMGIVSMHNKLNEALSREMLAGRRFVLAIDEAQNLDPSVLETIRLLSNFEAPGKKLLQILLIGQPQLARKLADPALAQLEQRIAVFARLQPFDSEETARYIAHRLEVAGHSGGLLFTPEAHRMISDQAQGIPRKINSLCFSALSLGYAMGRKRIDAEIMREVAADLDVESLHTPVPAPRASGVSMPADSSLSYRSKSGSRSRRWAMGALGIAASLAGVAVLSSHSPVRIGRFWPAKTEAPGTVQNSSISTLTSADAASGSTPNPSWSGKADNILAAETAPSSVPVNDPEVIKVVVQSGDTLRQITLRALGQCDDKLIQRIRELNPSLTNPDHIETDQEIRLPRLSGSSNPQSASHANGASGNSRGGALNE